MFHCICMYTYNVHVHVYTVRVKKSKHCYPTLPYLYIYIYPYCYPWVPYCYLSVPYYNYTCTCTTFALVYCCVGSSACICINVLLFKAHCLPRAVQCRFVAGIYCRGRDLVLHFTCKCSCKRLVNYFQVHVYKLT